MNVSIFIWLNTVTAALAIQQVLGQTCYYPNGNVAPSTEKPCSTAGGSACCPDSWICLDNGLCHYPAQNLYERYSCTDKSWSSPGCPSNLCTYGGSASGAESITQCSNHNDSWCCNADAQHVNCCQESPVARPFFALEGGQSYATIGVDQALKAPVLSSITGIALSTGGDSTSKTSRAPLSSKTSTLSASSLTSATPTQRALGFTSIRSSPAEVDTTFVISLSKPLPEITSSSSTQTPKNDQSSAQKYGLIVGCAIGIPLGLVLLGVLIWMLRRQRQQKAHPYNRTTESDESNIEGGGAKKKEKRPHSVWIAELEGRPFSFGRPKSALKSPIELDAGTVFKSSPEVPYGPNDFGFGDRTGADQSRWESVPPRYQPRGKPAVRSYGVHGIAELGDTAAVPRALRKSKNERRVTDGLSKTYG